MGYLYESLWRLFVPEYGPRPNDIYVLCDGFRPSVTSERYDGLAESLILKFLDNLNLYFPIAIQEIIKTISAADKSIKILSTLKRPSEISTIGIVAHAKNTANIIRSYHRRYLISSFEFLGAFISYDLSKVNIEYYSATLGEFHDSFLS